MKANKPNRLVFEHQVQVNGATRSDEVPFIIGVIANLSGVRRPRATRRTSRFLEISEGSIDELIKRLEPSLEISAFGGPTSQAMMISLEFASLNDFEPNRIAKLLPSFRELVAQQTAENLPSVSTNSQPSPSSADSLNSIDPNPTNQVERLVEDLNTILHSSSFESLHAAWLGLAMILKACRSVPSAKVAVLDISKEELTSARTSLDGPISASRALTAALEHLSSNMFGGHPPAALVIDFEFGHENIDLLSVLAEKATAAATVFIGSASKTFLPRDFFAHINVPLEDHHQQIGLLRTWREFRARNCAESAFLVLPPVLLRRPYSREPLMIADIESEIVCHYDECVNPENLLPTAEWGKCSGYLWGSGAHAVACLLVASFSQYGWVAAISPLDCPGLIVEFPCDRREKDLVPMTVGPAFVSVWHQTSEALSELGFLPLVERMGTTVVALFEDHSCSSKKIAASSSGHQCGSAHLLYWLALNRLRHTFDLLKHHRNLTELDESQIKKEIEQWLSGYRKPPNLLHDVEAERRWPVETVEIHLESDGDNIRVEVGLELNYGSGRCAPADLKIIIPRYRGPRSSTKGKSPSSPPGSLQTDV